MSRLQQRPTSSGRKRWNDRKQNITPAILKPVLSLTDLTIKLSTVPGRYLGRKMGAACKQDLELENRTEH